MEIAHERKVDTTLLQEDEDFKLTLDEEMAQVTQADNLIISLGWVYLCQHTRQELFDFVLAPSTKFSILLVRTYIDFT